ncbi:putative peroxin 13 [Trypanosoma grayi]|uniref:putative peroxin 13 n=1 Tax=Trypanosoma grayi TaxID=71804 RepID=UPI0004F45173|nr:putative peroxin 13 [Trypanosoma grayi]KEG07346.1 putative peroxin 13 [Trypanosoma grayi]
MYGGYGGGMSSMYGGYGGGMPSMYGGYGSGMSSMYGGYGGGMSSMYGGYGGGMSSMYGGGLGTMGGMTGGMLGGGMMGGMSGGVLGAGASGGMLGAGAPGGMLGAGASGGMGNGMMGNNGQGTNSLLPPQSDQPQLTIPGKPAVEESPRERRARRRQERRQEKEALEKHRQQKKQFAIHSTVEVVGHVLQILIQIMRSGLELFGVAFGTFYSIKALKALIKSQENAMPRAVAREAPAKAAEKAVCGSGAPSSWTSKWKSYVLISALFLLMETLYRMRQRSHEMRAPRSIANKVRDVLTTDDEEDLEGSLLLSEENSDDDASSAYSTESAALLEFGAHGKNNQTKRIFVAMFDYESPEKEGFFGFKVGDRFVIEEYTENGWCEAIPVDGPDRLSRRGFVPGNFLRLLEGETKL